MSKRIDVHSHVVPTETLQALERTKSQNALRALVECDDTANAVLYLASDEARHVTGVNLNVNAGGQIV